MKFALSGAVTRVAMRSVLLVAACLGILAGAQASAQTDAPKNSGALDRVLTQMDTAAASFRSATCHTSTRSSTSSRSTTARCRRRK